MIGKHISSVLPLQDERSLHSAYSYFLNNQDSAFIFFAELLPPPDISILHLSPSLIQKLHYVYVCADQQAIRQGLIKIENVHCYYLIAAHQSSKLQGFASYLLRSVQTNLGSDWSLRGSIVRAHDFKATLFPGVYQPLFFHYSLCLASRLCHKAAPATVLFDTQEPNSVHKPHFCKNIGIVNAYELPIQKQTNYTATLLLILSFIAIMSILPSYSLRAFSFLLLLHSKLLINWFNLLILVVLCALPCSYVLDGGNLLVILTVLGQCEIKRRNCKVQELEITIGYLDITGYTSMAAQLSSSELRVRMKPAYSKIIQRMRGCEVLGFIGDAIFFTINNKKEFKQRAKEISADGDVKLKGGTGSGLVRRAWIGKNAARLQYFGDPIRQAMCTPEDF